MSVGSSTPGSKINPVYKKTPFEWMAPGQGIIDLLAQNINQSVGSNMGMKNLYGSGIMKDVFAEKLSEAAMGQTKLVPKGQWIVPGQGAGSSSKVGLK